MRIAGVNIPDEKKAFVALTYIYGIGPTTASRLLTEAKIDGDRRTKTLNSDEVSRLQKLIEAGSSVEGELRQTIKENISRLKAVGAYRGSRHSRGLPARGQRTKRNTRTVRGNVRKTVGSGRRKLELK